MEKVVGQLLQKHYELPNITFQQLFDFFGTTLVVTTCCINSGVTEYLSRTTTPNMSIAQAISMSMCVPMEFQPYELDNMLYCDGGSFGHSTPREFPDKSFDLNIKQNECLAFRLQPTTHLRPIETQQNYAEAMLMGFYSAFHIDTIFRNCITLTCDASILADKIPIEEKHQFIEDARNTTESWFKYHT